MVPLYPQVNSLYFSKIKLCTSLHIIIILLFIVLVHQITCTHNIHCSGSNYSESVQKSSLAQALITVL